MNSIDGLAKAAKATEGTLIGCILKIMAEGDFYPVDNEVEEGDAVIGEMTSLEKAIYSLRCRFIDERNGLAFTALKLLMGNGDKNDVLPVLNEHILFLNGRIEETANLLLSLIKERLPEMDAYSALGVSKGYQIIGHCRKKEKCDCPDCRGGQMLGLAELGLSADMLGTTKF